jgi:hypothetical protein
VSRFGVAADVFRNRLTLAADKNGLERFRRVAFHFDSQRVKIAINALFLAGESREITIAAAGVTERNVDVEADGASDGRAGHRVKRNRLNGQ